MKKQHRKDERKSDGGMARRKGGERSPSSVLAAHRDQQSSSSSCSSGSSTGSSRSDLTSGQPRTSSSLTNSSSATEMRPRLHRHDCLSSSSQSKVQARGQRRQNKRMRTKSSPSTSPGNSNDPERRRRSDEKPPPREECKRRVNRADRDPAWRNKAASSAAPLTSKQRSSESFASGKPSTCEGDKPTQRFQPSSKKHVDAELSSDLPGQEDINGGAKSSVYEVEATNSEEPFDLASQIFKGKDIDDQEGNIGQSHESRLTTKPALKKSDKRTMKVLKLSDERRKREYLGYQPTTPHNLYSFGINNKGKGEPRKTALSKKEEDVMFRKRAVYMMHLEEQEQRRREDKRGMKRPQLGAVRHPQESLAKTGASSIQEEHRGKNNMDSDKTAPNQCTTLELEDVAGHTVSCDKTILRKVSDTYSSGTDSVRAVGEERNIAWDHSRSGSNDVLEHLHLQRRSLLNDFKTTIDNEDLNCITCEPNTCSNDSDQVVTEKCVVERQVVAGDSKSDIKPTILSGNSRCLPSRDTVSNELGEGKSFPLQGNDKGNDEGDCSPEQNGTTTDYGLEVEGNEKSHSKRRVTQFSDCQADAKEVISCQSAHSQDIGRHSGLPLVLMDHQCAGIIPATKKDHVIRITPETMGCVAHVTKSNQAGDRTEETGTKVRSVIINDPPRSPNEQHAVPAGDQNLQGDGFTTMAHDDVVLASASSLAHPKGKVVTQPVIEVNTSNSSTTVGKHDVCSIHPQSMDTSCIGKPSARSSSTVSNMSTSSVHAESSQNIPISVKPVSQTGALQHDDRSRASCATRPRIIAPAVPLQSLPLLSNNGNVYVQRIPSTYAGKLTPIQLLNAGARSVNVRNGSPVIPFSPEGIMRNNRVQSEPDYASGGDSRASLGFVAETVPRVQGHDPHRGSAISRGNQTYQSLMAMPQIGNRQTVPLSGVSLGVQTGFQMQNQAEANNLPVQGFIGYINVPVIKDGQGRLVVILPNNQTIQEATRMPNQGSGLSLSAGSNTQSTVYEKSGASVRRAANSSDIPQPRQTSHGSSHSRVNKHDFVEVTPKASLATTSLQTQCATQIEVPSKPPACKLDNQHSTINIANASSTSEDSKGHTDVVKDNSRASHIVGKPASKVDENGETKPRAGVQELKSRQQAITGKLKELRSVRALIAMDGRMGEDECTKMTERLKQVEDLLFRRLIVSSVELAGQIKSGRKGEKSTDSGPLAPELLPSGTTANDNYSMARNGGEGTAKSTTSGHKSEKRIDKLFDTATFLRNCINAMANKRQPKMDKKKSSTQTQVRQNVKEETSCKAEASVNTGTCSSQCDKDAERNENAQKVASLRNVSSTTVSTETDSDMSIEFQGDRFQPLATGEENHSNKIVLRLQRMRNSNESSTASEDNIKKEIIPLDDGQLKDVHAMSPTSNTVGTSSLQKNINGSNHGEVINVDQSSNESQGLEPRQVKREHLRSSVVSTDDNEGTGESAKECDELEGKKISDVRVDRSLLKAPRFGKTSHVKQEDSEKVVRDKCPLFTGPSKEQARQKENRERELVKQAWTRVFPCLPSSRTAQESTSEESMSTKNDRDGSQSHIPSTCTRPIKTRKMKRVKHTYGNPVIRSNLSSIGNINISRQVGGTSETKFQWLLKQLHKKRNGGSQPKPKDQKMWQQASDDVLPLGENPDEAKEYVTLVSRGIQTSTSEAEMSGRARGKEQPVTSIHDEPLKEVNRRGKGFDAVGDSARPLQERESSALTENDGSVLDKDTKIQQRSETKKRGRDSTGSSGKPQEKLPRISSPTPHGDSSDESYKSEEDAELQELMELREEVLSRHSSSSEETVGYSESMICAEEMTRRVKLPKTDKRKCKSIGTMTLRERTKAEKKSRKQRTPKKTCASSVGRRFATKTRGHVAYGWSKKKNVTGGNKSTNRKSSRGKRSPPKKVADIVIVSDESTLESSVHDCTYGKAANEMGRTPKRRSTLASLSARLWDECYWSTLNDTGNADTGNAQKRFPSNNSPPTTRRTGLEDKMLQQWGDLLRYSGNRQDIDTLPVTVEELENMNLPPPVTNSMRVLLEGYQMAQQTTQLTNENSLSSTGTQGEGFNENNSADIRHVCVDESAQTPWEQSNTESTDTGEVVDTSGTDTAPSTSDREDTSTEFTLDTLTSHGSDEFPNMRGTSESSSTTQSPPQLEEQEPSTNLRRWQTREELPSGSQRRTTLSPDYAADTMNINNCHEEGDSARSGTVRAGPVPETTAWQIGGAGDLREPRSISATNVPPRNRRRQNRVISWPNIPDDRDDPDDNIPLARLIEREVLKKMQKDKQKMFPEKNDNLTPEGQEMNTNHQGQRANEDSEISIVRCSESPDTTSDDSEASLPGPFFLERTSSPRLNHRIDNQTDGDCVFARDQGRAAENVGASQDDRNDGSAKKVHQSTQKRAGKFLYGDSKKGKSLLKKPNGPEATKVKGRTSTSSTMQPAREESEVVSKRYVLQCRPDDDEDQTNHAFYKDSSSPDVFC